MLRRLPLAARAPLLAAALMAPVGIVASQQALAALTRAQEARLGELARLHVSGLSIALGPAVLRRDVWEVFDTLDRAQGDGGGRMRLTVVADEAGGVIAATDPRRAPVGAPITRLAAGAQPLDAVSIDAAAAHLTIAAPLVYQGREVGRIVTELDTSDLAAERRRAMALLLLGNAAATALLALAGYLLMRRALRPVSLLAARMSEGAGAPAPIPAEEAPRGDHEVARLIRTYNEMAGAVEAQAEAERRLAERERLVSLGRLSSSLAHEINNPLGGLLAAADTIRRYADRPEAVRESAALLERGLRHLRDVARAALDHNRLDLSGAALRPEDFDDLRFLVTPEATRRNLALDWRIAVAAEDLAALSAGPVRQLALNLLLNAAAAAAGAVTLSVAREAGALRIEVSDDGPGMPEAALSRLLSSEPVRPGGGVGLRLARDLTLGLGGALSHRREGGWTVIVATLPLAAAPAAAA